MLGRVLTALGLCWLACTAAGPEAYPGLYWSGQGQEPPPEEPYWARRPPGPRPVPDPPLVRHHHRRERANTHHQAAPQQQRRNASRSSGHSSDNHVVPECPSGCLVTVANLQELRAIFQDHLEEPDTSLVHFRLHFRGTNHSTFMEDYPYMANNFHASQWVWASERLGRKVLGLPLDADVLSLYILDTGRKQINVHISSQPSNCLVMLSPNCRVYAMRQLLILNLTNVERHRHRRDYVCHRVINATYHQGSPLYSHLMYQCCDTAEFRAGDHLCHIYSSYQREISGVLTLVNIIAAMFTLFSPIVILKVKLALKFDNVTKFFRASLKHGITGQRNYVIRISSRQLINLSDPKPFSIPRFVFRLVFHCYGEGRCCIHWWSDWRHQPETCCRGNECRRCWLFFWRFFAVVLVYPFVFYAAIALYSPRLQLYTEIINFINELHSYYPVYLNVNLVATSLVPTYNLSFALWMLFSYVSFVYTALLLSWPNNPLERCLLNMDGKRAYEQPNILYDRMTQGYKRILQKLAYGDFPTKRHFFRVRWVPWGIRRIFHFFRRLSMQVPIINICFSLTMFDNKMFGLRKEGEEKEPEEGTGEDQDEARSTMEVAVPSCLTVCKCLLSFFIWLAFVLLLAGYCTSVFMMAQFVLNVIFFTFLGSVLHAGMVLPWISLVLVLLYYLNDTLATINREHRDILALIDENSPRISAIEDTEDVFRHDGTIQILRTHNLGAVKFIDGDNTEYVSKELYYNVCADLKCGWNRTLRRILVRLSLVTTFVSFVFLSLSALGAFTGSGVLVTLVAVATSVTPKVLEAYRRSLPGWKDKRNLWARIMPDILDRHIRVDRTQVVDQLEEELTTYDVRPVGMLEMDIPRMIQQRSLRLWKFPWIVSADQQTQSQESFIIALANKLAAASFLSKLVTRAYSPELHDETVLRQWCLLVENCIMEGSATASSVNGIPVESIRLFPRDVQPLVSPFNTGTTIDNVVDAINRELYGPFTKGVLVTIGNTTLAMCKLDNIIFAFNSSCHGDQVTDLFGAVLLATEFNTQNLQSTIKFIVDPYAPDAVPVYSIVPIEGFVFRSAHIMEMESPIEI